MTPAKFATAHVKASISSGLLVKVLPNYPLDGQPAVIQISSIQSLLTKDDEYKELTDFPGPLVKGVTHKKTIIEYCENKIKNSVLNKDIDDLDSYVLMWELLILLLRQNGVSKSVVVYYYYFFFNINLVKFQMVVGTDIAELLMKNRNINVPVRPQSASSLGSFDGLEEIQEATNNHNSELNSNCSMMKEEVVTNKFREYLIYGSEKEALGELWF